MACNFTKSNIPPWVFFTFFKLYKWYQMAQNITYIQYWKQQRSCKTLTYIRLSYFGSLESFYIPWKYQIFRCFQEVYKETDDIKVVNTDLCLDVLHYCHSPWKQKKQRFKKQGFPNLFMVEKWNIRMKWIIGMKLSLFLFCGPC